MTSNQSHLLSPYRPPTSYPVTLNSDEALAWLNAYAAMWHPLALFGRTQPPQASSAYDHDIPIEGFLYVIPEGPTLFQPEDWPQRVLEAKAFTFKAHEDRQQTFAQMKECLRDSAAPASLVDLPEATVRLFTGLGFGYLMLDTLFDAMNHDRLLDGEKFWQAVTQAVEAAVQGDAVQIRTRLTEAAQMLMVAREGAYSGTISVMDWLTLDEQNLGEPWPTSLTGNQPVSLLTSASMLERLKNVHPERFAELKSRFPADLPASVELCIGSYRERDDALLPVESQIWNLRQARTAVKDLLGVEPSVYARQRSAYHPQLPSWLSQTGFRHAITVSFDKALVPTRYSAFVNWSGPDGKAIDAFSKEPLKASEPQTYFNLGYHLHQAIQHDSTPTVPLLHSGKSPDSYIDWLALNELAPLFGQWTTMMSYFTDHHAGDYAGASNADEYFCDYLDDRVSHRHRSDPVSGFADHARLRRRLDSTLSLAALYRSLNPETPAEAEDLRKLVECEAQLETAGADRPPSDTAPELLANAETLWSKRLAERLQVRSAENQPGIMVLNPCGFPRRVALELSNQAGPIPVDGPVKASEFADGMARVVVEVPGLGFAWVPEGKATSPLPKPRIKTAEGTTVRNDFFEVDVDPNTGGIRAFRDMRTRLNRLGQILVYQPGSKMVARKVGISHAGAALGEVTSEGEIHDEQDKVLAQFRQRIRAWIGRPAIEMRIEITPAQPPQGFPWHAFYGSRFVWRDARAAVLRGVNGSNTFSTYSRPVSPDYLEFRLGNERTFLFTGGLPFVQKTGNRMIDLVLITEGETRMQFDLLLSADREHPMQTAMGWTAPAPVVETRKGPPHIGASGWLAAVDMPSLLLTSLRPTTANQGGTRAIAARFLETAGYAGSAELRFARDPNLAWMVDLAGQPLHQVQLVGDAIPLEFSASECIGVHAEWL